jgi:hypothetical protein
MKLYVANCTKQVQDFIYRLPETAASRQQKIDIGGQIRVSGDLTTQDIDAIIEQHSRYGMVNVDTIDRTKEFVGVCYSVDKPVDLKYVRRALEINQFVLEERGREIRTEAAVATANSVEEQNPGLHALEMSVQEVETKSNPNPTISEGTRVSRFEDPGPTRPSARRGNRKAA